MFLRPCSSHKTVKSKYKISIFSIFLSYPTVVQVWLLTFMFFCMLDSTIVFYTNIRLLLIIYKQLYEHNNKNKRMYVHLKLIYFICIYAIHWFIFFHLTCFVYNFIVRFHIEYLYIKLPKKYIVELSALGIEYHINRTKEYKV